MKKQKTKKIVYLVVLFIQIIFALFFNKTYAATNSWPFTTQSNYTASNSTSFTFSGGIAELNKNTLVHNGVITNATTYNGAYDVVVDGNYAYMTNYLRNSVSILNISNPAAPTFVSEIVNNNGTIRLSGAAGIVKSGNYLFVASKLSNALQVIDVSNPAVPVAAGQVLRTTINRINGIRGLDLVGNSLYAASDVDDALTVFDISTPTTPAYQGKYRVNNGNLNGARDVKVVGNYAYVAAFDGDSFAVVDISTPTAPVYITRILDATNLNGAHNLVISGNYAYVSAYNNNSVRVIDISTPTAPVAVTNISGGTYSLTQPRDLEVQGNNLFISSFGSNAVNVADITTPTAPTYVTKILHNAANPLLQGADGLFMVGDYLYTASYTSDALEILKWSYDITSPTIIPISTFNYGVLNNLTSFNETLGAGNQGTITYQISKNNGTTWYYWTGAAWATTVSGVANSSSASVINANLVSFNALGGGTGLFTIKAFFTSNGSQKVNLDNINIVATSPPTPGGVSSNLSIWLKANKGTSTTTDGAALTTWNDQSGNGFNATSGVAPTYQSTTASLNFNPLVNFNGTTQYLQNTGAGAYTHSYFAVVVPNNQVDGTLTGSVPFSFTCTNATINTGTCGLPFGGLVLGAFTAAINDEVITHAIGASTEWRSAQIGAASYQASKPMLVNMNQNAAGTGTEISEKGMLLNNYNANTYQTLSATSYRLGMSNDPANPFPYNGKIAEIINYSTRTTPTEKQKIESYLSLKYGMTLANGTINYLASDGSTNMWNTSTAGAYIYDIYGIGRDDGSELTQIKSKSVNDDGIITLEAVGEGTNIAPSFVDIADKEFLTISNNNSGNTWTATDSPVGYFNLARKWKVQETGEVGTLNLDFNVANILFDVPVPSIGTNYYFTYDSNGNALLADETPTVMTNLGGNIWRIAGININNNRIFSISTQASSNNIPTDITLSVSNINENVAANSSVGSLSTTDADPLDTHTYTFVAGFGSTDNVYFSIVGSSLKIIHSPDFEIKSTYSIRVQTDDGNGGQFQKVFTISINDLFETVPTTLDFENILDDYKYTITSGNWSRTTTNPYEGTYSLESNNLGNPNTQSCFEVNNTLTQTGTINFYYNVSSQTGSDFLRFYIDNIEQQAWSGTVPWTLYSNTTVPAGSHNYKWCYIKDGAGSAGTDNAFIDFVATQPTAPAGDTTPPVITSINFSSGTLLPGGNHNIIINYSDPGSGINTSSDVITLNKWNGTAWGSNIAATGLNLGSKVILSNSATYTTNNLTFGKYKYDFQISDNSGNSSSTGAVFYIDQPELIISSGSLDIGDVKNGVTKFSSLDLTVTVKTVGAGFDLILNKDASLTSGSAVITDWNGVDGFGYEQSPYTSTINLINTNEVLTSEAGSIDINGNKNTYIYNIKFGALVGPEQEGGDYEGLIRFGLDLNY